MPVSGVPVLSRLALTRHSFSSATLTSASISFSFAPALSTTLTCLAGFSFATRTLVAIWRFYFMVMRNTVARVFLEWKEIYDGLPRLIEETRWLTILQDELTRNHFTQVKLHYLTLYGSAIITAVKE